ncbi:MAG TPA: hypothetical protein VJT50_08240 [Pyrinomonadaceae bacterium]|nr:hypothetical protein [Pyrinomonadaceae bacterium]
MQVCSQCQFIYEDDQERCDMDGAELVYEPTLDHAFPVTALLPEHTKLIIPIDADVRSEIARVPVNAAPRRIIWQTAAAVIVAGLAFLAFYAARASFGPGPSIPEQSIFPHDLASVPVAAMAANMSVVQNAAAPSPPTIESKIIPAVRGLAVAALPGLKPLPRLKPLPTLKPIPRLGEQNRAMNANHKGSVVTAKPRAEKKESRLGAFLKKTGQALKKPFK